MRRFPKWQPPHFNHEEISVDTEMTPVDTINITTFEAMDWLLLLPDSEKVSVLPNTPDFVIIGIGVNQFCIEASMSTLLRIGIVDSHIASDTANSSKRSATIPSLCKPTEAI